MLAYILRRCGSVYLQEAVIGCFDGQAVAGSVVETQDVRVLARVVLVPETTLEGCGVMAVVAMFVYWNAGPSTNYEFVMESYMDLWMRSCFHVFGLGDMASWKHFLSESCGHSW